MLEAHKRDITLNQLALEILQKKLNENNKVCIDEMKNSTIFDRVMEEVIEGAIYTIYEDREYMKPLAKMIPYGEEQ